MKIKSIIYNWYPGGVTNIEEFAPGYDDYEVGKKGVIKIKEHRPEREVDKWFYDVYFKDGKMTRIFNPNIVVYFKGE